MPSARNTDTEGLEVESARNTVTEGLEVWSNRNTDTEGLEKIGFSWDEISFSL